MYSDTYLIEYGTPQGSCLGPLIFLIFANNMSLHLTDMDCIQFVDDTTLVFVHRNKIYLKYCIECELSVLQDWFYAHKLTLNVDKSLFLFFEKKGSDTDIRLTLCNKEIPRCKSAKFLGTWINDKLSWVTHVKKLLSKLKCGLGMLQHGNQYLTSSAKRVLYYGQIHSNLIYGITIWGPMISKKQYNELFKLQKRCVRLIDPTRNVKDVFRKNRILTLDRLIELEQSKLGYKLCHALLPTRLEVVMKTDYNLGNMEKSHKYSTRSKKIPNRPTAKQELYRKSFLYCLIKSYSSLPMVVRDSTNYIQFVKRCKRHLWGCISVFLFIWRTIVILYGVLPLISLCKIRNDLMQ